MEEKSEEKEIRMSEISTAALAYLGDCVIELCVREKLVKSGLATAGHLNEEALKYVKASAQAEAMKKLMEELTEEENGYFHRGRNLGHSSIPKRATVADYRAATGMETLFGYLKMTGQEERIRELFQKAYQEDALAR